ncbi:hypothetical protein BH10PLA2_BH10PLA2_23620 [soil metagenome]
MIWQKLALLAACAFCMNAAGCDSLHTVSGYLAMDAETSSKDRVINAQIDQVASKTQVTLTNLGYVATVNRQGEEYRIASKNSYGDKFAVVLTSIKTKDGEQTKARIDWEGGRDDQTGFLILAQLEKAGQK